MSISNKCSSFEICLNTIIYIYIYIYILYIYIYIYIYIYTHTLSVCVCVCVYIYIHTYILKTDYLIYAWIKDPSKKMHTHHSTFS